MKDYLKDYLYAEVVEKDMDPIPSSVVDLNLCHTAQKSTEAEELVKQEFLSQEKSARKERQIPRPYYTSNQTPVVFDSAQKDNLKNLRSTL